MMVKNDLMIYFSLKLMNINAFIITKKKVKVKLVCGSDLLESFNIPGVWKDEDVYIFNQFNIYILNKILFYTIKRF